uniref:Uncharacterized protein n=1 Tax=Tetraselmis sp. GSL018 TaxID=582737 RepID=A0A061S5J6_9CHLO|mmetsp:Transcript_36291/g.86147  ORF Transcript_36291/g.86147 Transcript_36291/m.86147 type:complete len:103 (+) Transcript_36291:338-646(+)|eukprot:CAMPEP_0177598658 /NCGR_PEP_ID=MMETSP0419_2-20121207/12498_1 /TAXON_ID=582737 /ORGANISM="Tetraselmis sp., Strain GSL018" /LENGTH=102 /DNA_ID=CAMNT_0019091181 /DNA_START=268 /DNA_END=576 /DNA_ORIENTATION=-
MPSIKPGSSAEAEPGLQETIDRLRRNDPTLTDLRLPFNEAWAEWAEALADALKGNNFLKELDLVGTEIGAEGAEALAEALALNTALTELDIGGEAPPFPQTL